MQRSTTSPDLQITSFYIRLALSDSLLACGSSSRNIPIFDLSNFEHSWTLEGHLSEVSAVSFSCNGDLLASCSDDTSIRVWRDISDMQLKDFDSSWPMSQTGLRRNDSTGITHHHDDDTPTGNSVTSQKTFELPSLFKSHPPAQIQMDTWVVEPSQISCELMSDQKVFPRTLKGHFSPIAQPKRIMLEPLVNSEKVKGGKLHDYFQKKSAFLV
jgi:WD40 repeat protein